MEEILWKLIRYWSTDGKILSKTMTQRSWTTKKKAARHACGMGTHGALTQHFAGERSQNEGCYNRYNRATHDSWKEYLKTFCEFVIKFYNF